jgi:hypothetical protein
MKKKIKLEDLKFELEKIDEITFMPIDKVELIKIKTIIGPNGKPINIERKTSEKT